MPTLLVASTGGHLAQLHALWPRIRSYEAEPALWVTFDRPQSRSLLDLQPVEFLSYIPPRGAGRIAANAFRAQRLISRVKPSRVISTGSGIALAVLPVARLHGIPCHYIESVARSTGPSLTGKLLRAVPGVETYCQYPSWANETWTYAGSIFDDFEAAPSNPDARPLRIVVTLGTIPYRFERLIERLEQVLPPESTVTWQLGETHRPELGGDGSMPYADLQTACREADVIVAHAGAGSALMALEQGKVPILVPRRSDHGEHVDDHQQLVAEHLHERDLAILVEADLLTAEHLARAASLRVRRTSERPPVRLAKPRRSATVPVRSGDATPISQQQSESR